VVFDLFDTLLSGANGERDVVVTEMAWILGVDPWRWFGRTTSPGPIG
jgi:hypothetical protein